MNQDVVESAAKSFIESYREAFERGDVAGVLDHFGDSVHITSDTGATVTSDSLAAARLRETIEQLVSRYRHLGVGRIDVRSVLVVRVSQRLAAVKAGWALFDRTGEPLYEFSALYTLECTAASSRIVAITHDEVAAAARYRARI